MTEDLLKINAFKKDFKAFKISNGNDENCFLNSPVKNILFDELSCLKYTDSRKEV